MTCRLVRNVVVMLALAAVVAGCAHMPGGIAASSTPINGRTYTDLGPSAGTDSLIYLFGFLPLSGGNSTRQALDRAVRKRRGDALINVTVECYTQYWFLFARHTTKVEGDVIRFQ